MSGFLARNKPTWNELEALVRKGRKSLRSMSVEELSRLDVLYRRTTIHLAQASTRSTDTRLITYLNSLTASAHSLIYLPPRRSMLTGLATLLLDGIARSIARNWRCHVLSAVLMIGGAWLAYFASMTDPLAAYALWPQADPRQPGSTHEQLLEGLRDGRDQGGGRKFLFASFLFTHNLKVGILAMASGVLVGVPTALLMIYNGMVLGVFVAIHVRAGIDLEMWAWILPHGVTELGAIILCGGTGFILGRAVLAPGLQTRAEALRVAGGEAGTTAMGALCMLFAAAIIESFLRQSHLSTAARLWFAGGSAVFWALFIWHGLLRERAAKQLSPQQIALLLDTADATASSSLSARRSGLPAAR
ncbi:MAG: stage II sporulation protein M [Planctomycetia bacterium]|nr:stage II sporulation protein M [Planctomycetia bacterium]